MKLRPLVSRTAAAWSGGPSLGRAAVTTRGIIPAPSPVPQVGTGAALMQRVFPKGPPAGACRTTLSSDAPVAGNTNGFLSDALLQKPPGASPALSWTAGTLGKPPLPTKAAPLSMAPPAGVRRPALLSDATLAGNFLPKALHKAPSAGKSPVLGVASQTSHKMPAGFSWIAGSVGKPPITSSSADFSTRLKSIRTAARAVPRATYYTSSQPAPFGLKVLGVAVFLVGGLVLLKKYGPVPDDSIPDDYIIVNHEDIGEDYED